MRAGSACAHHSVREGNGSGRVQPSANEVMRQVTKGLGGHKGECPGSKGGGERPEGAAELGCEEQKELGRAWLWRWEPQSHILQRREFLLSVIGSFRSQKSLAARWREGTIGQPPYEPVIVTMYKNKKGLCSLHRVRLPPQSRSLCSMVTKAQAQTRPPPPPSRSRL